MKRIMIAGLLIAMSASFARANSSGPADGLTGAPGEGNCTGCHASFPVNSGTGSLVVDLPPAYEPGTSYDVTVTLADPSASRWGFELTALTASSSATAGVLASLDGATQVSTGGAHGRTYVKHTSAGTQQGQTVSGSWTFSWTAPAGGTGDVIFHVAGNAANGNFSTSGDRIYTSSATLGESAGTGVGDAPLLLAGLSNAPNPFNPATEISFDLPRDGRARLAVFALDGRRVAMLHDGHLVAGGHAFTWRGTDDHGRAVPSGTYLLRLVHAVGAETRRAVLVR